MKKIIVIMLLIFTLTLTSCSHIEDINGPDDYSLATFKDEDLLGGIHSCSEMGVIESSSKILDKATGTYKVSKISGMTEIEEYRTNKDIITFTIEVKCEAGNALVIVISNNEIIKKIEANQSLTFEVSNNDESYRIFLVGESAKVTVKYNIES